MGAHVAERAIGRGAEIDRRPGTRGGRGPGRVQELLRGRLEVVGAVAHELGVADADQRVGRQHVHEELEPLDEHRGKRLHSVDGVPRRDALEHLAEFGMCGQEVARTAPHVVGEQQFPARVGDHRRTGLAGGTLIGHLEDPDLVDSVTEEVDPYGVLFGRREHVENAAAHREFAAPLDQVDPGVGSVHEGPGEVAEVEVVADGDGHGGHEAEAPHLRLEHGADGCHYDAGLRSPVVAHEPAQHGEAAADGVRPGTQPLVRQRLPGRVVGHVVVTDHRRDLGRELLGLAVGGGDQQQGAPRTLGESGGEEGSQAGG